MQFKLDKREDNSFNSISYGHMNQNMCLCPAHVPDTLLLGVSWELCSKYIWVCLLIRIDVTVYLSSEMVAQMLSRGLCIDQEGSILSSFICQPQHICWCSLGNQLPVWLELPSVLCFTLAYVSGSYSNTLHPIMKRAIPSYTKICLNSQFFTRIVCTPLPGPTHHTYGLWKQKLYPNHKPD